MELKKIELTKADYAIADIEKRIREAKVMLEAIVAIAELREAGAVSDSPHHMIYKGLAECACEKIVLTLDAIADI